MSAPHRGVHSGVEFERILAQALRRAGWRVQRAQRSAEMEADLVIGRDGWKYVVKLKTASEARRDRMTPLLSQAILQAQAVSSRFPESAAPLAVVAFS
jgi:HJR/Mrr/RecB family endonuclease